MGAADTTEGRDGDRQRTRESAIQSVLLGLWHARYLSSQVTNRHDSHLRAGSLVIRALSTPCTPLPHSQGMQYMPGTSTSRASFSGLNRCILLVRMCTVHMLILNSRSLMLSEGPSIKCIVTILASFTNLFLKYTICCVYMHS